MEREKIKLNTSKTILIAPLDWGLGHATRCMPLIDLLLKHGNKIIIAGNGDSFYLLKNQYPTLLFYELPGYNISYSIGKNASFHALMQTPKILKTIREEQKAIADIATKECIDLIISDNRYGVRHPHIKSIIICHQIALQAPKNFRWTNSFFLALHLKQLRQFDTLWIPDEEGDHNLSGILSHAIDFKMPTSYIGKFYACDFFCTKYRFFYTGCIIGTRTTTNIFGKFIKTTISRISRKNLTGARKNSQLPTNI